MKTTIKKSFEFDGNVYTAECSVEFHTESDYGSDADGGRGTFRTFIDDFEVLSIENAEGEFLGPHETLILSEYLVIEPADVL